MAYPYDNYMNDQRAMQLQYPYGNMQMPIQPQNLNPIQNIQQKTGVIPGRYVNNLQEITPQEIPMDGTMSIFPQTNGQVIYGRVWKNDGTIETRVYALVEPNANSDQNNKASFEDEIRDRLSKIEKALSSNAYYRRKNNKPHDNKERSES